MTQALNAPPRVRLGEALIDAGAIDSHGLRLALDQQSRDGGRLGEVLVADRLCDEAAVWCALASQWGMDFALVRPDEVSQPLAAQLAADRAMELGVLPLRQTQNRIVVACTEPPRQALARSLELAFKSRIELVITTPRALRVAQEATYRRETTEASLENLARQWPEASARRAITTTQRWLAVLAAVGFSAALWWQPGRVAITTMAVIIVLYALVVAFRIWVMVTGSSAQGVEVVSPEELMELDDLPVYTILCPLFREAEVLVDLVASLAAFDYPHDRLDVKLLVEPDDEETSTALEEMDLPWYVEVLVVPGEGPRTKPKACTFGLQHARGDYVVIYDAEDRPDPDQLRKAVAVFRRSGEHLACVQAKLSFYNPRQNLLTGWFTLEYTSWFDMFLPGLIRLGLPVPLGGTSNHFPTHLLRRLGGWDPFNVTEDADLGVRLHRLGFRTAMMESTTFEEANSDLVNWVRQRSRWGKGYAITWLVHMRHPLRVLGELGLKSFVGMQFVLAGTFFLSLLNVALWVMVALWILARLDAVAAVFPPQTYYLAMLEALLGNVCFLYLSLWCAARSRQFHLARLALLVPLYWLLMSVAMMKAGLQLAGNHAFWEKTKHGLAAPVPGPPAASSGSHLNESAGDASVEGASAP